jgi:hypothetical protein
MNVVECDVPSGSMLCRELIERANFRDSYRVPLSHRELGIVDVFFGIFAHHPPWMKLLLIVRNMVASLAGLDAPTASEILHVEIKDRYVVGEKIGAWPIFSLSEDEIVTGRNNKHMDFRLSVLKVPDGDRTSVVVSTIRCSGTRPDPKTHPRSSAHRRAVSVSRPLGRGAVESKQPLVKECGRRSGNRRDLGKTRLNQLYLFKGYNSPSRLKSNPGVCH